MARILEENPSGLTEDSNEKEGKGEGEDKSEPKVEPGDDGLAIAGGLGEDGCDDDPMLNFPPSLSKNFPFLLLLSIFFKKNFTFF